MAPREFIPDEKRSLRMIFFISSMILVATTVWALWDEAVSRRPWIKYQIGFKQHEYEMAQEELEKAKAKLNQPEVQAKLKQLQEERRWAEETLKGPAYKQAVRKSEELERASKEIDQELQFTKSELDEAYYWYDKTKHEGKNAKEELKEVRRLEGIVANLQPRVDAAAQKMEEAKAEIRAFERTIQGIQEKIQEVTAEVTRLERRLEAIRTTPIELRQVVVEGLEKNEFGVPILRVDRCETCHLGIDRPGFENAPQPFRSHPNREAIFSKHPVGRFGCTVCHQGQGSALDYEKLVEGRIPDWPHGLDKERGGGVNILWDFPLLRGGLVQSSCRQCHLEKSDYTMAVKREEGKETKVTLVNLAPILTKGRAMFEVLGCHGCHPAEGFKDLPKVGPDLTRIAAKVEPGWLIQWIQNPQSYLRYTRMPNFGLSKEEATAIAAYLLNASEPNPPVSGRWSPRASSEKGKEIFERVGCLGCHTMRAVYEEKGPRTFFQLIGRDFAPDLSNVAVKIKDPEWLFRWLKNPHTIRPRTPMPSLRLTDEEASALTAFLMTRGERQPTAPPLVQELKKGERIEEGRRLIAKRGCFGCHDIKGFERAEKIAPELSNFGHKRLLQLFFGDAVQVRHTWEDWTLWKLKNPQIYATDRVVQLMPNFGFSDEEVKALQALLKSFTDVKIPEEYRQLRTAAETATEAGRRLVRIYNCVGCHIIEGRGGDVRMRYEGRLNEAPPPLVLTEGTLSEGEKVQAKWLFEFLKRPSPIRPWLEVRMPTFALTDPETETGALANYFVALAGLKVPFEFVPPVEELRREMVEAGRTLASKEYFSCGSCHVQGDKRPEGPPEGWAPDFALARRRLRPEWIVTWLKDPQKVQPGTNMPSFFTGPDSGPDNILGGDEEKQILALRDYLMSLGSR